ncbi:MAG: hypothetical protein HC888_00750 [Candidatus Competibacteraceae bacterium]|nr:hypothetical protein [Candidatus Competibacteraceae bacterium]
MSTRINLRQNALDSLPMVTTLCGSLQFGRIFEIARYYLSRAGQIVLTVSSERSNSVSPEETEEQISKIKDLHFHKIRISDRIVVLNHEGCIGEHTRKEIEFAKSIGVHVCCLEPCDCADSVLDQEIRVLIKNSINNAMRPGSYDYVFLQKMVPSMEIIRDLSEVCIPYLPIPWDMLPGDVGDRIKQSALNVISELAYTAARAAVVFSLQFKEVENEGTIRESEPATEGGELCLDARE